MNRTTVKGNYRNAGLWKLAKVMKAYLGSIEAAGGWRGNGMGGN